ncbi:rCG48178, partial [Rattus norvegicus]
MRNLSTVQLTSYEKLNVKVTSSGLLKTLKGTMLVFPTDGGFPAILTIQ